MHCCRCLTCKRLCLVACASRRSQALMPPYRGARIALGVALMRCVLHCVLCCVLCCVLHCMQCCALCPITVV